MQFGKTDEEIEWRNECREERFQGKYERLQKWHTCFAWKPVRFRRGPWAWLEIVERRAIGYREHKDLDGKHRGYEFVWSYKPWSKRI